jgi:uncharacterized membrane protein/uncharacterized membrane protein YphA (DoxX/SURF4 family)
MRGLLKVGRLLFAVAMAAFGVLYLMDAFSTAGPIPGPPWTPGKPLPAGLVGVLFLLAGVNIVTGKVARLTATILGAALFFHILLFNVPALAANLHDPGRWTSAMEILAMSGGAFILAGTFPTDGLPFQLRRGAIGQIADSGRLQFAVALLVFGAQHFMYARFVATLVCAWLPARLFWAYFTGVAFFASALSILAKKMAVLASILLATMFFLWVILLHVPRVAAAPHNGNEWTSLLVALAMSGISFALAGSLQAESTA